MPVNLGGFLIKYDEEQRATLLHDIRDLGEGFTDALSAEDWKIKRWEVCGLIFEGDVISHWALARKGRKIVTGKVLVGFSEITPTRIPLADLERLIGSQLRRSIVSARTGVGGRVAPASWAGLKAAVGQINSNSLAIIERLERLRDQSREVIVRPGAEIVAQQRDAVGVALEVFDKSGQLRKRTLKSWAAPDGDRLSSFLDGLEGVRTIEDQLIARDTAVFPGSDGTRHTVVGAVFSIGGRKLEVFNVNTSAIETSLGVDLLYWNEDLDAWTLVQYKSMERTEGNDEPKLVYRPDGSFDAELARMQAFRSRLPDSWSTASGQASYRLCGDGFFFKLCSRVQLEVLSDELLPGMYLPRQYIEATLASPDARGPRGGRIITYENTQRHITNTLFAGLVRDGWVGTRGMASTEVARIVREALSDRRAVVIARSRAATVAADSEQTLNTLGL